MLPEETGTKSAELRVCWGKLIKRKIEVDKTSEIDLTKITTLEKAWHVIGQLLQGIKIQRSGALTHRRVGVFGQAPFAQGFLARNTAPLCQASCGEVSGGYRP
jgi:hypothetical protein